MMCSAQRTARGAVECCEESVSSRVYLGSAIAAHEAPHDGVMPFDGVAPGTIAHGGGGGGRFRDIGEEHGGQDPV